MPAQTPTRKVATARKAAAPKPAATKAAAPKPEAPKPAATKPTAPKPAATKRPVARGRAEVSIDLALQGGGSHGAFTWGVLDRLLQEKWLHIDGISGTSAGAMNAVVLVDGYVRGGRAGARKALTAFWRQVSEAARYSPLQRGPLDVLMGRWSLDGSPAFLAMDLMSRLWSPYDLNPFGFDPLRDILERSIDFQALQDSDINLFITATNVRTGRGRVFRNTELTPDALLASACLPTMNQAVEVDGEFYWDGGFAGNPTITPLVRASKADDIIMVAVNPVERPDIPTGAREILNRINEVSFNAGLLKELRMIALLRQVADTGHTEGKRWASMRVHLVRNELATVLDSSSKMSAEWAFLEMLCQEGQRAADQFLEKYGDNLGKRSSVDLNVMLEGV